MILVQNNQFIFKVKNQTPFIIWFSSFKDKHYRPYYLYLKQIEKNEKSIWEELYKNVNGCKMELIVEDDILPIDLKMIKRFLMENLHSQKIEVTYQSLYLSKEEKRYVALAKTCRCVVMKYIKNGKLVQECYLPQSVELEEIKEKIEELHSDIVNSQVPILIMESMEDIEVLKSLGRLIGNDEVFSNYEQIELNEEEN